MNYPQCAFFLFFAAVSAVGLACALLLTGYYMHPIERLNRLVHKQRRTQKGSIA